MTWISFNQGFVKEKNLPYLYYHYYIRFMVYHTFIMQKVELSVLMRTTQIYIKRQFMTDHTSEKIIQIK